MKIAHIIHSLEQGGAENLVAGLLNELSKNNEVFLITFKDDAIKSNSFYLSKLLPEVKYINLKLKPGLKLKDISKLTKKLKQIKPDVVHCHLFVIYHVIWFSLLNPGTKVYHTIHNDAASDCANWYRKTARRFFYKYKLLYPVTISHQSCDSYNKFYKLNNSHLIYNGRVTPEITNKYKEVKAEINKLKGKGDKTVFIHVGRFYDQQKNQSMLVRVFNRLITENHKVILIIIGVRFDSDEAKELRGEAKKGIHFLGAKHNVPDYLANSDAFCLSSRWEGLPISLLEAFACGCVPVCTPAGGVADIITDSKTGFLSDDTSEEAYYQLVKRYLNNKNLVSTENLKKHYKRNFSIEICAKNHLALYKK